jgi:hypothetical protein
MRSEILPLPCENIFSLTNFTVNNQEHLQTNSVIHSVNTRARNHLHRSIANLSCFQKIFNSFKRVMNKKAHIKITLKRYLNIHSFYSVEELVMLKNK